MELPKELILTYQTEYETTPSCNITNLCNKYDIDPSQLGDYSTWKKREVKLAKPKVDVLPAKKTKTKEAILDEIADFKALAIAHATKFMRNDAEFADVKEFKDIVAIVDSIEKSYKDTKDNTTINVLIQNLQQRFKDTADDC